MSFYCFETRQDRTLAPYPPPEFSQQIEKMSPTEIVDHIINTNIDAITLSKIEKAIAVPLRQLISPRENRRRRAIPRPQNNFVLYRRNFHAVITKQQGHGVAKNFKLISNEAAKNWSEESNEIKQLYELIADCAKKVHDCTYPQYVYQPKHKSNKKGANGTIFREVTVDSCSKKNDKKEKDMKELLKEKEDLKRDKITMTKSFVASTTFLSDMNPPVCIKPRLDILASAEEGNKKWRWAHYTQSDPPNNVSSNNVSNNNVSSGNNNNNNNNNNNSNNNNNGNNNNNKNKPDIIKPDTIKNDIIKNDINININNNNVNNISIINNNVNNNVNNNNVNNNDNKSNDNNDYEEDNNNLMEDVTPTPITVSPPPPVQPQPPPPPTPPPPSLLLAPIDIPISSNFLATYDRNIWNLVNGYTHV